MGIDRFITSRALEHREALDLAALSQVALWIEEAGELAIGF
jgi:hypothetical protein